MNFDLQSAFSKSVRHFAGIVLATVALFSPAISIAQENAPPPPVIPPVEPTTIPGEPAPILDKPSLFPQDPVVIPVQTAISVNPSLPNQAPPAGSNPTDRLAERDTTQFNSPLNSVGAASAFGLDTQVRGAARPSDSLNFAERERDRATARAERQAALQNYNIKIGPVPLRFSAGVDFEVTDNVNLDSANKVSDLIVSPTISVTGGLEVAKGWGLYFTLSLGYLEDLNRPDQSRVLTNASIGLNTGSEIAFDIKIGHFLINFHESPQVPRDFDLLTQRNPIQYGQFSNTAGVTLIWDVNSHTTLSARYDHYNAFALKSELNNLDQTAERVALSGTYQLSDALSVGLQADASDVTYKQSFLNNAVTYSAGPFFQLRATPYVTFRGAVGYQIGTYGSTGAVGDSSKTNNWYGNLSMTHNVNSRLRQELSIGKETELGTASNATTVSYIRHTASWDVIRGVSLATFASYEDGQESGGIYATHFRLFELGFYAGYALTKKLNIGLSYHFTMREATLGGAQTLGTAPLSYTENRLNLNLGYAF